jgi:CarD family transcriptional regulator
MRKLSEPALVKKALETLKGRARVKRTMWSRRAQEYEAKINSGDIVAIAEVVRDLYRSESQPEQSYSERQLYEAALDRLSREIAVVQHSTETEAVKEIEAQLAKSPRRTSAKADAEGETDTDAEGEANDTDGDDTAVADEAA